jgi:isocitrate lyase
MVLERLAIGAFVVRAQHWCGAEFFDELQAYNQTRTPDTMETGEELPS